MSGREKSRTMARVQVILQRALVEIRTLAAAGRLEQTYDLANTVEFLPDLALRWDEGRANLIRPALAQYEEKYPSSASRYTSILDADETEFERLYGGCRFDWNEPGEVQSVAN